MSVDATATAAKLPLGAPLPSNGDRPAPLVLYVRPPPPPAGSTRLETLLPGLMMLIPGGFLVVGAIRAGPQYWPLFAVLICGVATIALLVPVLDNWLQRSRARFFRNLDEFGQALAAPSALEQELTRRWANANRNISLHSVRTALAESQQPIDTKAVVIVAGLPLFESPADFRFQPIVCPLGSRVFMWIGMSWGFVYFVWQALLWFGLIPRAWQLLSGVFVVVGMMGFAWLWSRILGRKWLRVSPGRIEIIHGGLRSTTPIRTFDIAPGTLILLTRSLAGSWLTICQGGQGVVVELPRKVGPMHEQILKAVVSTAPTPPADTEQL